MCLLQSTSICGTRSQLRLLKMFKVSPGEVGNKHYSGFNRSDWKRGEDQHKAAIKMALLLIKISLTSEIKKIIINIDHSKIIGASLSEPHYVRSTVKSVFLLACLLAC